MTFGFSMLLYLLYFIFRLYLNNLDLGLASETIMGQKKLELFWNAKLFDV